ncbi:hypothetical protein HYV43_07315 [Candidatus Micrarchaeota archaeon]|nr:hypothetical protein [Candidatus Micrarchaeota archaeon]
MSLAPGERFEAEVEVADVLDASVVGKFKPPKVVPASDFRILPTLTPAPTVVTSVPSPAVSNNWWLVGLAGLFVLGAGYWIWARRNPKGL